MDKSKAFRVDWYPREAFMDFSRLSAEEIGVLMQIINLIYSQNKAIENDPKYIGRACNITRSKCARIIEDLIKKDHIYLDEKEKINKKRCEYALKEIEERRKKYSENGKKGSKLRWNNEQNQIDENSSAISEVTVSTSTSNSRINSISTNQCDVQKFDIDWHLTDEQRKEIKETLPGHDFQYVMREYNEWVNNDKQKRPHSPFAAFKAWCKKYMKNNPL